MQRMSSIAAAAALALVILGGLAALSAFPRARCERGVFRDYSSPESALKSYVSAVYALDEERELASASRLMRYQSNRYRGCDRKIRHFGLAGKAKNYRVTDFVIVHRQKWGDRAQILVDLVPPKGRTTQYTFTFCLEGSEWKIDDMGPGNRLN